VKKFALCSLLLAFSVQAQVGVYPRVTNFITNAQVQINNQNDYSVNCSGFLYMHLTSGFTESQFFFDTVVAKGYKLGEEWTTSTADSNTWTQIG
jgi:hypothetical protein